MINISVGKVATMTNGKLIGKKDIKINGISTDTRKINKGSLFIPIVGENFDGHDFLETAIKSGATAALWDKNHELPNTEIPIIVVDDTVLALGRLAAAYRDSLCATFIAITGSNGKTSTKEILAGLLSSTFKTEKTIGNLNNHIGVPLTLLSLSGDTEMAVIEMGMSNAGEIDYLAGLVRPDIGIITNVGEAHLDTLGTIENVALAKTEMLAHIDSEGLLIYNGDQQLLSNTVKMRNPSCMTETFGENDNNDIYIKSYSPTDNGSVFETGGKITDTFTLNMAGKHQALNSMAALLACKFLSINKEKMKKALALAQSGKMRGETLNIGKVSIINDTYKSNPASVRAALDLLYKTESDRRLFVMGDMIELGEAFVSLHEEIGGNLDPNLLDSLYCFGEGTAHTAEFALKNFPPDKVRHFATKDLLVNAIKDYMNSPCAILFKASRALKFEELIEKLNN